MITKVMNECNNHFIRYFESPDITFAVDGTTYTIEGDFSNTYLVGQYIWIQNSLLNDGCYKITAVETGVLTVDTAVVAELPTDNDDTVYIIGLSVPKDFVDLVTEITTWQSTYGSKAGVASEKIDDYSAQYQGGANNTGLTWVNAFANRLSEYRAIFNDIERIIRYGY